MARVGSAGVSAVQWERRAEQRLHRTQETSWPVRVTASLHRALAGWTAMEHRKLTYNDPNCWIYA